MLYGKTHLFEICLTSVDFYLQANESFQQLNIFRFHLDGGSEIALPEVDEEAFELAAFLAHQTALEAIETTTDNAYLLAINPRGDLLVAVVFHIVGLFYGFPEPLKILGSHTHCLKLLAATYIAVLQQIYLTDNGIELFPTLVHKDKVRHVGDKAHHMLATLHEHPLLHGDEETVCHLGHRLQLLVGRILGVWT